MSNANTVTISIKDWEDLKKYKELWENESIQLARYGHLHSGFEVITDSVEIQKQINSIKNHYTDKLMDQKEMIHKHIDQEKKLHKELNETIEKLEKMEKYKNMSVWEFLKSKFKLK